MVLHPDDPLAVLAVADDGTAEGRFTVPAWFMPLRGSVRGRTSSAGRGSGGKRRVSRTRRGSG